ncbi:MULTISPECIES: oligosaccharide flippase family protein [Exiguobacterium]|uniref:oligosaccharide flippase family protein n=1 Tax=Exiguobacterium TaxID=33986 RepID=UPI001BEC9B12|nr:MULTISPECIES: oligosaccharide flippase family protein [Exiguobacterium]MCT4777085.1 oligosaccharide flippase family protein [Exiguobacterium aquaticum]MCT4789855.1 oligosaccharide flippase family protein [Exiguobacterium mexicanum]
MIEIKRAAALTYIGIFLTILITLFYTPLQIKFLGAEEFGVYSLVATFAIYLSILDLGLGNAVIRYISSSIEDTKENNILVGMFIKIFLVLGFFCALIGLGIYINIDNMFSSSLNPSQLNDVKNMILILTLSTAISLPLSVFGSIIQAHEKLIVFKFVNLLRIILVPVISIPLLFLDFKSTSLIVVMALVNISIMLYYAYYAVYVMKIAWDFKTNDYVLLKEVLTYSFYVFLNIIVDQIYWNTGQIILGVYGNATSIGVYALSIQFIRVYMLCSTAISSLFLPKLTKIINQEKDLSQVNQIFVKVGKIQFIILSYILIGFGIFGEHFISIWAGKEFIEVYSTTLILMIALLIPLIQNVGISILQAMNKHAFRSILYVALAVSNLLLSVFLVKDYGEVGIAYSTSIFLLVGNFLIMNLYYQYSIKMNMFMFWKGIFGLLVPIGLSLFISLLVENLITNEGLFYFIKIVFFTLIYVILNFSFYRFSEIFPIKNPIKQTEGN